MTDELGLATCSMGMTDDLELALDAGTTRVRVGTALFGPAPVSVVRHAPQPSSQRAVACCGD